ncbi:mitochondrial dicarboxylate/tricarboxylate transporter DTC isoform X2 [Arachis ipaensis]|uniref:mitochondrial dicarboxylate/tricarboxylate transporter DTC isoform X2 n=1 Tax=Arachis ipaensis TaxID=130454 RepID=UPI000A2B0FE0|nr:mitochondrial dicarboxylate/tricarboxylate transporter DTC isoform X2 [Arachis ipaensis]
MGNEKKRKNMDPVKIGLNMLSVSLLQPMDIIKVRMQLGQGSGAQIASNILKTEGGYAAFYRGLSAALLRLPLHKAVQAGSYSYLKDSLGFGYTTSMIGACAISSFIGCALSLPFDYVKTQLQTMQPDAYGKYPYTGSFDCVRKTLKTGGLPMFYSGFRFYYFRVAALTMISWFITKQLRRLDASISEKKITIKAR